MFAWIQSLLFDLVIATGTTIPDDFYNLYPDEQTEGGAGLGNTGYFPGPFIIGSIVLVAIGLAALSSRRRRRI